MRDKLSKILYILCCSSFAMSTISATVRLKSVAHLSGLQENPISGYGLVIGLAGSGDSRRNRDTTQSIANVLQNFGVQVNPNDINARNSATVIITASLPPFAHQGDKLDINVASVGDAKSLLGGTLLATPLKGPDNVIYALAQGSLSLGGFKYDVMGNVIQKNHPTAGVIPNGAIVEKSLYNELTEKTGTLHLILNHPDFTTADLIERALNKQFQAGTARARSAQDIEVTPPRAARGRLIHFIRKLENIAIIPDHIPTVVVNERTGIVVAGQGVKIDPVSISHGNLHILISTRYQASQPDVFASDNPAIRTIMVPEVDIKIKEPVTKITRVTHGTTVADLMQTLSEAHTSTRDIISILESLQRAGVLHAELIIQ